MATKREVQHFLKEFKTKKKIFQVVFRDDRGKNLNTLSALEITPKQREKTLEELIWQDYAQGPIEDTLNRIADLWIFGKMIKKKEIYIKISLGIENNPVICISFHIAEHPMSYPLKNNEL